MNTLGPGPATRTPRGRRLRRRLLTSDVSAIMSGTLAGQIVVVAASPVLTRLYAPMELGGFAVFLGLAATLGVIASLGYQLAIPLPRNPRMAASVGTLAGFTLLIVSAVVSATALLIRPLLPDSVMAPWFWLLGPCVLAIGGFQILFYWTTRGGDFRGAGLARLTQAVVQVVGQIGAGLFHFGPAGLVSAYVVAQFMGINRLWRGAQWPRGASGIRRLGAAARRYRAFPQFTMWASLANAAGTQLPSVIVGSLYGLAPAGHFSLALRVLALPSTVLGQAFAQVFYPRAAAAAERPEELRRLIDRATGMLFLVALVCFLPVIVLGRELFSAVFGAQWRDAGEFAMWIAVWSAVALVSSPVSTLALVAQRQRSGLVFTLLDTLAKLAALAVGGHFRGAPGAVHLFAVTAAISYLAYHVWTLSLVGANLLHWVRPYRRQVLACALLGGAGLLLRDLLPVLVLWGALTAAMAAVCWSSAHRLVLGEVASL